MIMEQQEPKYKLIQSQEADKPCQEHTKQHLKDLYNDSRWTFDFVDMDKLKFVCTICKSERVYQLLPEKTML
jgi:hypothetical protein